MSRGGPYYQGGPRRDPKGMAEAAAALRDDGGLPPEASLIFTQLLLNLVGNAGRVGGLALIARFLDAADVGWEADARECSYAAASNGGGCPSAIRNGQRASNF